MRLVATAILGLSLLSGAAWAQNADDKLKSLIGGKKRAKKAQAAQLGSVKDEDPAPAAAPAASAAACTEADLSLLRAVEYAFEPAPREIRVIAVEDLALLQDPRALNPLAHLILDPDPAVALAAVRTVGHFQHRRAEEILGNVIRHPQLSPTLKVAAVMGLPLQDTASSRELLTEVANSSRYALPVQRAAKDAIAMMVPPAGRR